MKLIVIYVSVAARLGFSRYSLPSFIYFIVYTMDFISICTGTGDFIYFQQIFKEKIPKNII